MEKVGAKIAELRSALGMSGRDLASRLDVTAHTVRRWESGNAPITTRTLREVASVLGVTIDDLLGDALLGLDNVQDDAQATGCSVFVSYGEPDRAFAAALNNDLLAEGFRTFFFPSDARPGQRLHRTMSQGVREHDRVVVICSRDSLSRTGVLNELEQALQREAEEGGAEIIVPITLDDFVFSDWAPGRTDLATQLRGRVIADFRNAEPGTGRYEEQFRKLIKAF